jgi:hypothetical protein
MKILLACVILFVVAGCRGAETSEEDGTRESDEEAFVPKKLDLDLEWLRHYGTFQSSEKELKDAAIRQLIVKAVIEFAASVLNKEVLPSERYAVQHMKLFPAGTFKPEPARENKDFFHQEDCVYLRYAIGARHYLLVKTYGEEAGRFFLFVRDRNRNNEIRPTEVTSVPLKPGVTWILFGETACLLVNLTQFWYPDEFAPRPAKVFQPDEWFEGARRQLMEEAQIEKARQRRLEGSPEYVKELLSRLPADDSKGKELYDRYLRYNSKIAAEDKDSEKRGHYITGRAHVIQNLEHRVMWAAQKPKPPDEPKAADPE